MPSVNLYILNSIVGQISYLIVGPKFVIFQSYVCCYLIELFIYSEKKINSHSSGKPVYWKLILKPRHLIFLDSSCGIYQITLKFHSYILICKCRLYFWHWSSCFPKYKENRISQIPDLEDHMKFNLFCLRFHLCLLILGVAWVSSWILLLFFSLVPYCGYPWILLLFLFQSCFATFSIFKSCQIRFY